ncbi:hypothetical protein EJV47_04675 [Hymenobacter gummosus]|uniref:Uncharacterized protein n=1 Tax=Hymenobacter gummosus TaxID=1776032 RepID=A0A431U7T3_9BACT|nr:type II TA system antitoxin MqsA family protein [Hymenobacter gummosus]RTQ52321.1 hypothetical protein EJV47_04675 [Hymenobacter gummosus]
MLVSPFTGGAVREILDTQPYTFRGEQYDVTAPVYECVDTGEQFTTNEQDEEFLRRLHAMWRARHRVPAAEELGARREELGLTAREMSALLGLGVNQWRQYEAGEVPSNSNVLLLRMVCSRQGLAAIVAQQEHELPERTLRKLRKALLTAMTPALLQPVSHELSREHIMELLDRQGGALPLGAYMTQSPAQPNSVAF